MDGRTTVTTDHIQKKSLSVAGSQPEKTSKNDLSIVHVFQ
jgi:hypothetical protein